MTTTQNTESRIETIMNSDTMSEWINGVGTNAYGGGSSHQLYLDMDNDSLLISEQPTSQSWLQRNDGSLVRIASYSNPDSAECEPYDDWEANYRDELETTLQEAIDGQE